MPEPALVLTGPAATEQSSLIITRSVDVEGATKTRGKPKRPLLPNYLLPAYQRLAELHALPEDWDSYGALPISDRATDAARGLLSRLSRQLVDLEDVSPYTLAPLASGGIQIEWRGPRTALEIEIDPVGRLSSLLVEGHETGHRYDERGRVSAAEAVRLVSQAFEA